MDEDFIVVLPAEVFDDFMAMLEREPIDKPKLRELFDQPSPFEEGSK